MEEARQELKNLMNELFVEDLKTKANELSETVSSQFRGAVQKFTRDFDEMVDESVKRVVDPKFAKVIEIYNSLELKIGEDLNSTMIEIENCKSYISSDLAQLRNDQVSKFDDLRNLQDSHVNNLFQGLTSTENLIKSSISEAKENIRDSVHKSYQESNNELAKHSDKVISTISRTEQEIKTVLREESTQIESVKDSLESSKNEIAQTINDAREDIKTVEPGINGELSTLKEKIELYEQSNKKHTMVLTGILIINFLLLVVLLLRN